MAEGKINPGSALGDFVEEFKKAPPAGKIAIVGVVVVVIALALYMRKKSASSSTPVTAATPSSSNISGGSGGSSPTSPVPVTPGNPAQPTPTPVKQGGGTPLRGTPIIQKPIAQPVHGAPPPPRSTVAKHPQATYKQPVKQKAPYVVYGNAPKQYVDSGAPFKVQGTNRTMY